MTNAATHIEPDCDATAQRSSLTSRLIDALTSLIVSALSFALLLYVGYGEARRTYEQFQIEKLVGQAELIQELMARISRLEARVQELEGKPPATPAPIGTGPEPAEQPHGPFLAPHWPRGQSNARSSRKAAIPTIVSAASCCQSIRCHQASARSAVGKTEISNQQPGGQNLMLGAQLIPRFLRF